MFFGNLISRWTFRRFTKRADSIYDSSSTSLDTLNLAVLASDPLKIDGTSPKFMMARVQGRQADDNQPPATQPPASPPSASRVDSGPPRPRQDQATSSKMDTTRGTTSPTRRPVMKTGNFQCTHHTMTRLYTTEFRCMFCLRVGSMGWIYRCTQDSELLIEETMDRGEEAKFDNLSDIFDRPRSPRPRSAKARLSPISFFDENDTASLQQYSPEQLRQILNQRAHVLEVVDRKDPQELPFPQIGSVLRPNPAIISPRSPSTTSQQKPWLPLQDGECQFKCCHLCRPHSQERSWLSLNGIVNDDIPHTAITGFGFHLEKKRPVALVKHVQNLGLRENPIRTRPALPSRSPSKGKSLIPAATNPSLGLGIFDNHPEPLSERNSNTSTTANIPEYGPTVQNMFNSLALRPRPRPRPLPAFPSTASTYEIAAAELAVTNTFENGAECDITDARLEGIQEEGYEVIPLPAETEAEMEFMSGPLTPMEELELKEGVFKAEPLEVQGGVAVMEESLGLRVADVVTQF